jgi:hypothetical protein
MAGRAFIQSNQPPLLRETAKAIGKTSCSLPKWRGGWQQRPTRRWQCQRHRCGSSWHGQKRERGHGRERGRGRGPDARHGQNRRQLLKSKARRDTVGEPEAGRQRPRQPNGPFRRRLGIYYWERDEAGVTRRRGIARARGISRIPTTAGSLQTDIEQRWTVDLYELNDGLFHDYGDSNNDEGIEMERGKTDFKSVRWRYRDETWSQSNFTYDLLQRPFVGKRRPVKHYYSMPTFLQLFDLFWTSQTLRSIVRETNRYAMDEKDGKRKPRWGEDWELLIVPGLKAFLGISV